MYLKTLLSIIIILICSAAYPQNKELQPKEIPAEVKTEGSERNNYQAERINSKEISEIESRLLAAKQTSNTDAVTEIQKRLDILTGSVTKPGEEFPLHLVRTETNQTDNIHIGLVSSVTGTKGIATCTEQVGMTAGRIWTAIVFGPNSGATVDQLRLCYS
ncbi:MAG: hypothetical protein JNJ56_15515, partial [Ignavibacteria bacterium]|nr:hypothetical protein [Ignavibacteria bacterium]